MVEQHFVSFVCLINTPLVSCCFQGLLLWSYFVSLHYQSPHVFSNHFSTSWETPLAPGCYVFRKKVTSMDVNVMIEQGPMIPISFSQ